MAEQAIKLMANGKTFTSNTLNSGFLTKKYHRKPNEGVDSLETHRENPTSHCNLSFRLTASSIIINTPNNSRLVEAVTWIQDLT